MTRGGADASPLFCAPRNQFSFTCARVRVRVRAVPFYPAPASRACSAGGEALNPDGQGSDP